MSRKAIFLQSVHCEKYSSSRLLREENGREKNSLIIRAETDGKIRREWTQCKMLSMELKREQVSNLELFLIRSVDDNRMAQWRKHEKKISFIATLIVCDTIFSLMFFPSFSFFFSLLLFSFSSSSPSSFNVLFSFFSSHFFRRCLCLSVCVRIWQQVVLNANSSSLYFCRCEEFEEIFLLFDDLIDLDQFAIRQDIFIPRQWIDDMFSWVASLHLFSAFRMRPCLSINDRLISIERKFMTVGIGSFDSRRKRNFWYIDNCWSRVKTNIRLIRQK